MTVRIGVVVFPGSNCDRDTVHALAGAGAEPVELWHEEASLGGVSAVILPGGFAYGDYLRAGVIARFSPVMRSVAEFAAGGGLVLGICNGFQVLAEAGLVPGALLRNRDVRFLGREVSIAAERLDTPFTHALDSTGPLRMPIAHGEGCYFADAVALDALEAAGGVLFRYVDEAGVPAAASAWVNGVSSLAAAIDTSRPRNRRLRLRRSAPGTSPASARTWNPLQMPSTSPPPWAKSVTARMTGLKRAMTPARR